MENPLLPGLYESSNTSTLKPADCLSASKHINNDIETKSLGTLRRNSSEKITFKLLDRRKATGDARAKSTRIAEIFPVAAPPKNLKEKCSKELIHPCQASQEQMVIGTVKGDISVSEYAHQDIPDQALNCNFSSSNLSDNGLHKRTMAAEEKQEESITGGSLYSRTEENATKVESIQQYKKNDDESIDHSEIEEGEIVEDEIEEGEIVEQAEDGDSIMDQVAQEKAPIVDSEFSDIGRNAPLRPLSLNIDTSGSTEKHDTSISIAPQTFQNVIVDSVNMEDDGESSDQQSLSAMQREHKNFIQTFQNVIVDSVNMEGDGESSDQRSLSAMQREHKNFISAKQSLEGDFAVVDSAQDAAIKRIENVNDIANANMQRNPHIFEETAVNTDPCTSMSPAPINMHEASSYGNAPKPGQEEEEYSSPSNESHTSIKPTLQKITTILDEELSSISLVDNATAKVDSYAVDSSMPHVLGAIFARHGDVAQGCKSSSKLIKSCLLDVILKVFQGLQIPLERLSLRDLKSYYLAVKSAEEMGMNVKWLLQRLDEILEDINLLRRFKETHLAKETAMEFMESTKKALELKNFEMEKLRDEIQELESNLITDVTEVRKLKSAIDEIKSACLYYHDRCLLDELS